ncbi:MAG: hypothetical protein HGA42_17400, partial [Nostocales cyanobacterium W4_Combined_metabat2_030]|nr:hypothetical protein [Nostocales cyanobacterium W4_Combined_metabat2_030]
MKANIANLPNSTSALDSYISLEELSLPTSNTLVQLLSHEMQSQVKVATSGVQDVVGRIAKEVERICDKSSRIQNSGQIQSWQITLGRHRLQKCLRYYQLGSKQGRIELHSSLGAIVYRHVAVSGSDLGFEARYNLIEDFLQAFY